MTVAVRPTPLLACIACLAAAPAPAAADEPSTAAVHGTLALEATMFGVAALNFGTGLIPNHGPGLMLNMAPLVLGPLAAYGAYKADLDPTPALAIHGAGWLGLDLFMLGALLDGRDESWGLRAGPMAWTLGALGAIAGGVLGATAVDDSDEAIAWMAAPPAGFVAGGLVLGGILVLAGGVDGHDAPGQLTTGALIGTTIGLGVAGVLAYREAGGTEPSSAVARLGTRIDPSPGRVMFSFGGAF